MFARFKNLLICLAVLAVGAVQVFGLQAGYLCECTGQRTNQEICEPAVCHPQEAHEGDCSAAAACDDECGDSQAPAEPARTHSEIREALTAAGFPPALTVPAVVFFELPPTFQMPDLTAPMALIPEIPRPEPPENGNPPMPLLVARTMVLLV